MGVEIDQALVKTFIDNITGLEIAHENDDFTPTAGTAYAELRVLQNDTTPLNLKDTNETDGVFRVLLNYPSNGGAIAAKSKADTIFSTFKIGASLTYSGVTLTIVSNQRQPGLVEEGWYRIILTMNYRAFIAR